MGYLWAVFEPCMFVGVWLGFYYFFRMEAMIHDMSPVLFMSSGLVPFLAFRRVASYVEKAISSNTSLLQFPLVRGVDTFLARFLLESATQVLVGTIIFGSLIILGFAKSPADPLQLLMSSAALLLLGFGFGVFNCMVEAHFPAYEKISSIILRLLFWTSGVFFLIDKWPKPIQDFLQWNPVLHGVELFRSSWSHTYQTPVGSIWYMLIWICGFFLIGLILERSARREILEQ
jgi:capsular polysaccharide transport system permease protein